MIKSWGRMAFGHVKYLEVIRYCLNHTQLKQQQSLWWVQASEAIIPPYTSFMILQLANSFGIHDTCIQQCRGCSHFMKEEEGLEEVTWWATVKPVKNRDWSRLSGSQGHRQKSAHKWLQGGRKSVPKGGSLAGGGTYNVTLKKKHCFWLVISRCWDFFPPFT